MINMKIDGSTGNLVIENGSIVRVQSDDAIGQNAQATLQHVLKEWFLNEDSGIDYFGKILVKNYDNAKAERIIKKAVRGAFGIANIESFSITRNGKALTCTFTVITTNNTRITLSEDVIL